MKASEKGSVMHAYRSHTCAQLNKDHVGQNVRLSGWVHRVRDHGGVLFIDLRDHYGITQVLADSDSPAFAEIEKVRAEWVISLDGVVKARDAALVNPKLPTGEIEVYIKGMRVLGEAATRTKSLQFEPIRGFLRGPELSLAGFKGVPLSFRPWDGQLRQPVLLAAAHSLIAVSPIEGFLHPKNELDTLGFDQPESQCHLAP